MIIEKYCCNCDAVKPITEFGKDKQRPDGFKHYCKICVSAMAKKRPWYKQYYAANKDKILKSGKMYRASERGKEMHCAYQKQWALDNPDKAKQISVNWLKANPGKMNAYYRARQLAKENRTPKWLTKEQLKEIEQFYIEAKELQWLSEERLEVDHIIPLRGKNVSGLHVPWNLQILPRSMNAKKSNKMA